MLYWYMYISMANGAMFVYRCCVQLFIIIHLVPILIHKSIAMCIMVALHCCINILNCISKYLFTNIKLRPVSVSLYDEVCAEIFTSHTSVSAVSIT